MVILTKQQSIWYEMFFYTMVLHLFPATAPICYSANFLAMGKKRRKHIR